MTTKEQLIEQHVREYEARLKHIDELYQRAQEAAGHPEPAQPSGSELKDLQAQLSLLRETTQHVKAMPVDKWRSETLRSAGPMAIWDVVAQKLEDFIERHE
jgi:hypothetical protein